MLVRVRRVSVYTITTTYAYMILALCTVHAMSLDSRTRKGPKKSGHSGFDGSLVASRDDEEEQAYEAEPGSDDHNNSGNPEAEDEQSVCDAMCCAPLKALLQPVEVGELHAYASPLYILSPSKRRPDPNISRAGYAGEAAFWVWPLFGPLLFENTSSDVCDQRESPGATMYSVCPLC